MKLLLTLFLSVAAFAYGFAQHQHSSLHPSVELNDGAKWKANDATTEGINAMIDHMQSYQTGESPDDMKLHDALMEDFNRIFKNCTMKGEAHEQLHHYLMPLRDMLAELASCEDCAHVMQHIDNHLASYTTYFE